MQISLSKNSDVPLRQQLAEQIIFQITTGRLRAGDQLPSVRALARQVRVHHNTVSEAYQELVRRKWVTRQRGSRLVVGPGIAPQQRSTDLDELINEAIQRAKEKGYSLQALTQRVRERLLAEPPDHILVVEDEAGLREIIRQEVHEKLGLPVEGCSLQEFARDSSLVVGAQVFAPNHAIEELKLLAPRDRPPIAITYSGADEHVSLIRELQKPSMIAVASISESLLKTARGLLAPAVQRRHAFREFLASRSTLIDLRGMDVVFCDSLVISSVQCRRKIHYRLVATASFEDLASTLDRVFRP